jgi:peptidoglycan/xylan/chitin deacetylase (PgdA/CDA1 family)
MMRMKTFILWHCRFSKKYEIPATFFVVAEATDKELWLWTDILNYAFETVSALKMECGALQRLEMLAELKTKTPAERDLALHDLFLQHRETLPAFPTPTYRLKSWEQLHDALDTGFVEVGSHSCTHPIFAHLDAKESLHEISGAKELFKGRVHPITFLRSD